LLQVEETYRGDDEEEEGGESRQERQRKTFERERKREEKDRQRRIYITLMAAAMFAYLNFAKNPFNK